jgi:hypothetical protein
MATESAAPALAAPADVGLKREMGLIGATWASMTSLIGSGWLFGSWKGAYSAGTSALLAWVIAGAAIIILALIHAELGRKRAAQCRRSGRVRPRPTSISPRTGIGGSLDPADVCAPVR